MATVYLTTLKNISESVYSGLRSYGTINVCLVKPEKSSIMAYGNTPYVEMTPKKMAATQKCTNDTLEMSALD